MPEWGRGKSVGDIINIRQQLAAAVPQAPPPAPTAMPSDDDFLTNPRSATEKLLQAQFGPAMNSMAGQLASTLRGQAELKWQREFAKYGAEIDALVNQVPTHQRTLDTYTYAVDITRGRHVQELAQEMAREQIANVPGTERSGGGPTAGAPMPGGVDFSKLPPSVKDKWERAGITQDTIREWAAKWGQTPEQFMNEAMNQNVVGELTDGSWSLRPEALKIPAGIGRF